MYVKYPCTQLRCRPIHSITNADRYTSSTIRSRRRHCIRRPSFAWCTRLPWTLPPTLPSLLPPPPILPLELIAWRIGWLRILLSSGQTPTSRSYRLSRPRPFPWWRHQKLLCTTQFSHRVVLWKNNLRFYLKLTYSSVANDSLDFYNNKYFHIYLSRELTILWLDKWISLSK